MGPTGPNYSSCGGPAVARTQGLASLASHAISAWAYYAHFHAKSIGLNSLNTETITIFFIWFQSTK